MSKTDTPEDELRQGLENALYLAEAAIECEDAHNTLDSLGAPAFSGVDETPPGVELSLAERIRRLVGAKKP